MRVIGDQPFHGLLFADFGHTGGIAVDEPDRRDFYGKSIFWVEAVKGSFKLRGVGPWSGSGTEPDEENGIGGDLSEEEFKPAES